MLQTPAILNDSLFYKPFLIPSLLDPLLHPLGCILLVAQLSQCSVYSSTSTP